LIEAIMPMSLHRIFKNSLEFMPVADIAKLPLRMRGIYVLFVEGERRTMNVVYVGMARGEASGIEGRLASHRKQKPELWTHFSVFEAWDNISVQEIEELEGLFRHIYRKDALANKLNKQRSYKPLDKIRRKEPAAWK